MRFGGDIFFIFSNTFPLSFPGPLSWKQRTGISPVKNPCTSCFYPSVDPWILLRNLSHLGTELALSNCPLTWNQLGAPASLLPAGPAFGSVFSECDWTKVISGASLCPVAQNRVWNHLVASWAWLSWKVRSWNPLGRNMPTDACGRRPVQPATRTQAHAC